MKKGAIGAVLLFSMQGCAPVVPIPPGSDISSLVLSRTTPEAVYESVSLNGLVFSAPHLSFDIPSGRYAIGLRYRVEALDRCDSQDSSCSLAVTSVTCSGSFLAAPNVRYRILIDPRKGLHKTTIQRREGAALYLGQEEVVLNALACEIVGREERRSHASL